MNIKTGGTKKMIYFKRGEYCFCPTTNRCWRTVKEKYLWLEPTRMTRQHSEEIRQEFGLNAIDL